MCYNKNMHKVNRIRSMVLEVAIVTSCLVFSGLIMNVKNVNAGTGAEIGGSSAESVPSSDDGGGGTGSGNTYGYQWVYYSATGNKTTAYQFEPNDYYNGFGYGTMPYSDATIPATCSESGRGFWIFGLGAKADVEKEKNGNTFYEFGTTAQQGESLGRQPRTADGYHTFVYSAAKGKRGLRRVIPWVRSHTYMNVDDDSLLDHQLWMYNGDGGYDKIYYATKFGKISDASTKNNLQALTNDPAHDVWSDFKTAWLYKNGTEYTGKTFPDNLVYFCFWNFEDQKEYVDLTLEFHDIYGIKIREPITKTVEKGQENLIKDGDPQGWDLSWGVDDLSKDWDYICVQQKSGDGWGNCVFDSHGVWLSSQNENQTWRIVFRPKKTFKIEPYGVHGNYLAGVDGLSDVSGQGFVESPGIKSGGKVTLTMPEQSASGAYKFYCIAYWSGSAWTCIEPGNRSRTEIIGSADIVYRAIYLDKHTLTVKHVTTNGGAVDARCGFRDGTSTYWHFGSINKTAETCEAYEFTGWVSTPHSTTSTTYAISSMTEDITAYAVYKIKTKTLTNHPVDRNGKALDGNDMMECRKIPGDSVTVNYWSSATVKRNLNNCYTFEGWAETRNDAEAGKYSGSGGTYTVDSLTSDKDVYSVYTLQKRTLTIRAYDTDGHYLGDSGLGKKRIEDVATSVDCGGSATVTRRSGGLGYSFKYWYTAPPTEATKPTNSNYKFTNTNSNSDYYLTNSGWDFNARSLTANYTIYAIYELNDRTLTGIPIDENGKELTNETMECRKLNQVSHKVKHWGTATITRPTNGYNCYTFLGWVRNKGDAGNSSKYVNDTTYTNNNDDDY